ncbi:hypothetical protein QCN27_17435 [Cereibacter sp. SYSU M97828]|nr:hypothetical protein [Cereibacter flavus]
MRRIVDLFRFPDAPRLVSRWFWTLALIDLALVALFLALRLMQGFDMIPRIPPRLDIFSDTGLPERFNHAKWAGIAFLLLLTFHRLRVPALLAMSVLFLLILADDSMRLHERGSEALAILWPNMPTFGMTRAEAGEVTTWSLLGAVVVPILAWGFLSTPRDWWPRIRWPMLGFAGILFFAIGMDVAQQPLWFIDNQAIFYWGKLGLGLIEDTGEAVFGSLTLAYCIGLWHLHARASEPVHAPAE